MNGFMADIISELLYPVTSPMTINAVFRGEIDVQNLEGTKTPRSDTLQVSTEEEMARVSFLECPIFGRQANLSKTTGLDFNNLVNFYLQITAQKKYDPA